MSFFSGNMSGHRKRIKYYEHDIDSISKYPSIASAHGTWVTDDTNNQSGTASSWFLSIEHDTGRYDIQTWEYDNSTHTLTEISHFALDSGSLISGSWGQTTGDMFGWGQRWNTGSGYGSWAKVGKIDDDLTGINMGDRIHDTTTGPYGGVKRGGEDFLIYYSTSGAYTIGTYGIKTTNGAAFEFGGLITAANGNWGTTTQGNHISISEPNYIGGNGSTYSEPTHNFDYFHMNYNPAPIYAYGTGATHINFEVHTWDGDDDTDQARTYNEDVVALPTHAGSIKTPISLPTSWGNVVIHFDTNTVSKSGCFPITWSGTTPTSGDIDLWVEHQTVNPNNLYFGGTMCGGSGGSGNKYGNGQHPDDLDVYRTVAIYEEDGSTYIDFVELEFRYVGSVLKHSAYVIHKKAWSVAAVANSESPAHPGVTIEGMIFQKNKKDVLILFAHTDADASDDKKHKYVYFEGAYR